MKLELSLNNLKIPKKTIAKIINNENILNEFCVPAGTKGVIRGNEFNKIVKNKILSIFKNIKDKNNYDIAFEKKLNNTVHEIPDWYILQRSTGKALIGMNQIDLWTGGQQTNRGAKYILNEDYHKIPNTKIISVVCKRCRIQSKNNKVHTIFKIGFEKERLCFLGNLENIILRYFN
jgi:hypothetical protein